MIVTVDESVSRASIRNGIGTGREPVNSQIFVSWSTLYCPKYRTLVRSIYTDKRGNREIEIDPQIGGKILVVRKPDVREI